MPVIWLPTTLWVISKSPDSIFEVIVFVPVAKASSVPFSCSKYIVLPSVFPTTSNDASSPALKDVAWGRPNTDESCHVPLAKLPVVQTGLWGDESI